MDTAIGVGVRSGTGRATGCRRRWQPRCCWPPCWPCSPGWRSDSAGFCSQLSAHASDLVLGLSFVAMAGIGILLLVRRPQNPIGWMLAVGSVLLCSAQIGPDYLLHWLIRRRRAVSADGAADAGDRRRLRRGLIGAFILLPLVFPDGHLLSHRWRSVVWLALLLSVIGLVTSLFDPSGLGDGHRSVNNPLGIPLHAT